MLRVAALVPISWDTLFLVAAGVEWLKVSNMALGLQTLGGTHFKSFGVSSALSYLSGSSFCCSSGKYLGVNILKCS